MAWPSGLQSLSFGFEFNQSLEGVAWPSGLQSIAFDGWFEALKRVNWPMSLQCLVVAGPRSEVVEMCPPPGLQSFEYILDEGDGSFDLFDQKQRWMMISTEDRTEKP